MPILTVGNGDEKFRIQFNPGQALRDILDMTDFRAHSGCRGLGACGLCLVRIEAGEVNEPTTNESLLLDSAQLGAGIRLACQVMPEHDLQIVILAPAPESNWRSLPGGEERRTGRLPGLLRKDLPQKVQRPYGVAVDLGTTHISLSLYELSNGQWTADRYGLNPQLRFGSDVMTRLMAASESTDQALIMSQLPVKAIGEALFDIASREGIDLQQVVRLTLVGNTAMLALLSGRNFELLLQPSHWMTAVDCMPDNTEAWAVSWGIHPQARVDILPPMGGFVGSDLLAGVVTTRLTENVAGALLIDFGTNSEIALWDGEVLRVTSAAGGPAFEGSSTSCGLPAGPGAIYRVNMQKGVLNYDVMAGSKPRGLCGSGLVDLIANLIRSGTLTSLGRFAPAIPGEGFSIVQDEHIVLTKGDVDVFQRAKAAIGSGIQVLLAEATMKYADLQRICVGGAFGRFLNVTNAQDIGLLPKIQPELVELCGNTALTGCEDVLLSSVAREQLKRLREEAKIINLSRCTDFEDIFLGNLYLQPMRGD